MKLFKKTLAMFLSALMLAGLLAVPATQAAAAGETVTRTINLLDLSETAAGTVLSKDNLENWPKGMTVGDFDDYDGTRSVVELEDGTKALKLAFDKPLDKTANGDRMLYQIENYELKFAIPSGYRKYLTSFEYKTAVNAKAWDDNWITDKPYYRFGFTDGKSYAAHNDQPSRFTENSETVTLNVTETAKVDAGSYTGGAWDLNSRKKWSEEDKANITDAVVAITVPCTTAIDQYVILKEINITVTGTTEELDAAERESLRASALITDFESDSNAFTAAEDGVFAASGTKVYKHYRNSGAPWEGDFRISLDSRVRFYDGISFYLYNPNEAKELKCYLRSASGAVAQKNFTASKAGDYIKYTVWFDDVGTTNGNWDSGTTNTGTALTADQIAGLTAIQFRVPGGGEGVSYYFDDFRYEKHNSEPTKEKVLDLTTATVEVNNGYTDSEIPVKTADGITLSLDGTRTANYQGWQISFDVSDGSMINANGIEVTAQYNTTGTNTKVIGSVALIGKDKKWKWGENPDALTVSTQSAAKKFYYTSNCHDTWALNGWSPSNKKFPTGTENATMQKVNVYIWAPEAADASDTVTITGVKILYGGSKVYLDSSVTNGNISVGDNGYTYSSSSDVNSTGYFFAGEKAVINVIPNEGYALVPGTLKLTDSNGKEVEVTREGFRKLNSTAYSFTMPTADVNVKADFAPEADVLGTVYSNVSADIANNQLKFDYTVPLKNGKIAVDGTEYRAVGYGVLVTTGEVLEKYSFWDGFTVEDIENGNYIAELSTNVHVNESEGYFYDKSVSVARFNAVVNIPDSMKDTEFAVRAYVEYENADGNIERKYDDVKYGSFTYAAFGMSEFAADPSYAKGVNMAGLFDNTAADASALRNSAFVAPETYTAIAFEGFDHVRLPVTFASHLDEDGNINADYLEAVDKAVIAALSNELTVVIDLHHYGELKDNVSANEATFYSIWEQLAEHYKNYPNRVIFELLNEPNTTDSATSMTSDDLNRIQLAVVGKIRAIDNDRKMALAVFNNNSAYSLQSLSLPADKSNLIISIHNYDAYKFTHQDLDSNCPVGVDYAASGSANSIDTMVNTVREYSKDKGIPIWISEFGVYLGGLGKTQEFTDEDVTKYYYDFTNACGTDIGWCVWEFNVGFGVFDSNNQLKDFVKKGLFPTN